MSTIDTNNYKPNSHKAKAEAEREALKPIVNGEIHKKTKSEKFKDSIFNKIIEDILIPSLIDMVREGMHSATDMLLPGGSRSRRSSGGRSRTPYHTMGNNRRSSDVYDMSRPTRKKDFDFTGVNVESLQDAEDVRQGVLDAIDVYDQVRVADFYSLCNVSSSSTDNIWGWTTQDIPAIRNADVLYFREDGRTKYWIDMPRPRPLI